jgi:hypothetical protein
MRGRSGQSVVVLIIFLSIFVIAPLSVVVFEFSRYSLAKQQLKACVDSAALAAGATTASSNVTNPSSVQTTAFNTAMTVFQQNTVLNNSLSTATQSSTQSMTPGANQAQVYFQLLDPVTKAVVPLGSTNGKIVQVTAAYGVLPVFGKFLNMSTVFPAYETSNGGLPMLDVVLCFDISSSMDDFTPVSIINRYNAGTYNGYKLINQGPLYTAFNCSGSTGTALNATFPQNLDAGDGSYSFSSTYRGTNNGASAPSTNSSTSTYTDVVVNIDGTNNYNTGTTVTYNGGTYLFPASQPGVLVEAARGNLESVAAATLAKVPYATWGVTPKSGYFNAYVQAAFANRHPICDAISASQVFFSTMNNNCDAHFGLVTFGTSTGTTSSSVESSDISAGSIGNIADSTSDYKSNACPSDPMSADPPNPCVDLNPTAGPSYSNFSTVSSALTPLVAYGGTNISGALQAALKQLMPTSAGGSGLSRTGAKKAIVLFTDGLPTESSLGGNPATDARTEASVANTNGIPIYCIGLCMVSSLQASQTAILTDQSSNASTGGIAGISGNGAAFYQATSSSTLELIFENVARALVQLVRA